MATPSIHVVRFWTDFRPSRIDAAKLDPVDKVAYGPVGGTQRSVTICEVKRLSQIQPGGDDVTNPAISLARLRWDLIRPQYEAWKSGQEMPLVGTPLAAWNAVTPEQAEVLKSRGVKTVENIAELNDASIEGIPVPHMRELKRNAQRFLDSAETTRFAAIMAEKDRTVENQQSQINEQSNQIAKLVAQVNQLAQMAADKADAAEDKGGKGGKKAA